MGRAGHIPHMLKGLSCNFRPECNFGRGRLRFSGVTMAEKITEASF